MRIALLTIGDELLNGDLCDSNTPAIARVLAEHHLTLRERVTVRDRDDDMIDALQRLADSADAVIVTGGLGPTDDDRTARAAAKAFNKPLRLNDAALAQIRQRFEQWQRPMHPGNEKQALLPSQSRIIPNLRGTAPGFHLALERTDLFFLPGVPDEMLAMLTDSVLPVLQRLHPAPDELARRRLSIFGLAEPDVAARLNRTDLPQGIQVAYAVEFPIVQVKLQALGPDAEQRVDRAELLCRQTLGDYVVALGEETLARNTARLLVLGGQTLALAESCTGGLIAKMLTDAPGASAFLERGIVSYANSAKQDCLGVSSQVLVDQGAVSAETARQMATGVRNRAATDIGLAVTGIAGPDGGTASKPVGTVFIAMVTPEQTRVERFHFAGDRQRVRLRTAYTVLDWLRRDALVRQSTP